ncbi:SDR family oxidoreductase [Sinomonas sp. ASV486]|uniref:SDR family NAD(P)-dependent oxidoreductase n=1 Tax=Sinomonas sp. ASV486 TaxID=3051170 RepID=UPI0027DC3CEF|nr:SDR family oxidoreductase [Sinomonas sp. ASV486]MDQ4491352.1 SDR family oxidoreductase [Sinomonas sp. ASV486]
MGTFSGRRVLLVGTGGIGAAVALRLAAEGSRVFGTYRSDHDGAAALGARLPADSWAGSARLDAADPASVDDVAGPGGSAGAALGGIDTLVVTTGHRHPLEILAKTDPAVIQDIVRTELVGPMLLVRAVLPEMVEAGFGRIVLVGSDSGKAGTLGDAASSSARAGLHGLARAVARETARTDVTINVVSPGPTDTGLLAGMLAADGLTGKVMAGTLRAVPKGRAARPEEVAAAVAHLASAEAGFTTGQVLSVSGGLTM